jgi:hypothetical protein
VQNHGLEKRGFKYIQFLKLQKDQFQQYHDIQNHKFCFHPNTSWHSKKQSISQNHLCIQIELYLLPLAKNQPTEN